MDMIRVISMKVLEEVRHTQLSWLQSLVCRWFKITPAIKYNYRLRLLVFDASFFRYGDILVDDWGDNWYVDARPGEDGWLYVRNVAPMTEVKKINSVVLRGSSVGEC